jgi:hypothetical protein
MITISALHKAFLELLNEIKETHIKLILGGGFGLYLKTEHVRKLGIRTLFSEWPEARSTNDLDLFVRPELLIHSEKLKPLAAAIEKLGYKPVKGAEKYQFIKSGSGGVKAGSIKLDILTGPRSCFSGTRVKTDDRRAKPQPSIGLHAHPVDEAPTLEKGILSIVLEDRAVSGANLQTWQPEVYLPHPFTFLMMKLHAFKDRLDDADKDYGRYHALDLYSILATTTEIEWNQAIGFRDEMVKNQKVIASRYLVSKHFSVRNRIGIVRMMESPYFRPELQIDDFISALKELFPT